MENFQAYFDKAKCKADFKLLNSSRLLAFLKVFRNKKAAFDNKFTCDCCGTEWFTKEQKEDGTMKEFKKVKYLFYQHAKELQAEFKTRGKIARIYKPHKKRYLAK